VRPDHASLPGPTSPASVPSDHPAPRAARTFGRDRAAADPVMSWSARPRH